MSASLTGEPEPDLADADVNAGTQTDALGVALAGGSEPDLATEEAIREKAHDPLIAALARIQSPAWTIP